MAEPDLHPAELGLHRGRRLGAGVLLGALVLGTFFVLRDEAPTSHRAPVATTPAPIIMPPSVPQLTRAASVRRAQKRPAIPARAGRPPEPTVAEVLPPPQPLVVADEPSPAQPVVEPPPPPPVVADEPPPAQPVVELTPPPPPLVADEPPPAPPVVEATVSEPALAAQPAPDGNGEAIARAIAASKRAAVRACFESELKQQPTLRGNVLVELDLAPPNRVNDVRVTDDLERPAFTRCVTDEMRRVHFASLDEALSVAVPYVLSPERK